VTGNVSKSKLFLARVAVALIVVFLVSGLVWYGFSAEVRARVWQNLLDRPGGPMAFRFILQPVMATIVACLDGIRDARTGRTPFFEAMLTSPDKRAGRLHEAVIATARIILLGLVMDTVYQFIEFTTFHPAEAAKITLLLAFVPYVALRGIFSRIARWWIGRGSDAAMR
jgi:hypothetical protein